MAYSPKRAPKMPAFSVFDSARDGSGLTRGQKRNNAKIAAVKRGNAAYSKEQAAGLAASKRARAAKAKGAAMKGGGGQHRGAHGRYT